ncbi:hypothetical protein BDV39DRAFT_206301 [Aspergillus sergii]|uniref:Uncharacterized protein n=1 Tax=Aspergillus sergii TaxID=1034303 RepID=A0A5N6WZU5_9EURO|nr:hypothetical protein BDV39DRAFT_206301 [Aspergillus sergii]
MTYGDDVKQLHHGPMISEAALQRFEQFVERAQEDGHELIYSTTATQMGLESDLITKELFEPLFAAQIYDDASPTGFEDVCELIDFS